jgi:dTDP-4-amino-4,6-dideoxygalactose transaminase
VVAAEARVSGGATAELRARLLQLLCPDGDVTLFWKGRVALYAILRALDIGDGDEVLLPAFTCVVVPSAILYRRAVPVYVDIDARTFDYDPVALRARLTPRTRAILVQNTFGRPPALGELGALARRHRLHLILDSAHGLQPVPPEIDAAFFSLQWNKPLSTGLGGFAVARDPALALRLRAIEAEAAAPTLAARAALTVLLRVRDRLRAPALQAPLTRLYRALSRHDLVMGSSQRAELEAPTEPARFLTRLATVQARRALDGLSRLSALQAGRRRLGRRYAAALDLPAAPDHDYLRFPVRVRERAAVLGEAERGGLELGDWFSSPIHPIVDGWERWGYRAGSSPVAEGVCRDIVNLPTHERVDDDYFARVVGLVRNRLA